MQPPRSILYWKIAVELVGHTFHITVLMGISYRSQSASLWPKIYSFPLLPAFGVFLFVFLSPFLMLNSFWNFLLWVNVFLNIYRPVYSCFFQSPKTSHLFSKGPSFSHQQHKIFFFFLETRNWCSWYKPLHFVAGIVIQTFFAKLPKLSCVFSSSIDFSYF